MSSYIAFNCFLVRVFMNFQCPSPSSKNIVSMISLFWRSWNHISSRSAWWICYTLQKEFGTPQQQQLYPSWTHYLPGLAFFVPKFLVPMHLSNKNIRQPNLSSQKSIKIVQIGLGSNCWNQVCQLEAMRYKKTQKDNEFRWNKNRQTVPAPFCLMRQIWENPIQDWRLFRIISWHGCKNCWQHKLATNPPKVSRVILNKQHLFKKCLKFIGKLL